MAAMMGGWRDALAEFEIGADWLAAAEGGRVLFGWVLQVRRRWGPCEGPALVGVPAARAAPLAGCNWWGLPAGAPPPGDFRPPPQAPNFTPPHPTHALPQGLHTKAPLRGVPAPAPGGPPRQIWSCGVTALSITAAAGASQTPNTAAAAAAAAPTGDEEVVAAPPGASGRIWRKVSHANGAELLRQLGVFGRGVAVPPELLA